MGKRHTGRKLAMQALYQADMRNADIESVTHLFIKGANYVDETKDWALFLSHEVTRKKDELDKLIQEYAIDWDIDRINPIDKNILRIALFELKFTDTPETVVVDEAVEIAKKYSTEDSGRFINGLLGEYLDKRK